MIQDLPNKLKESRLKYGYSQREVADRLQISPSIVSGYETGERTPSVDNLISLSYLYKCSTDYLLGKDSTDFEFTIDVSGLTHDEVHALNLLVEAIRKKKNR